MKYLSEKQASEIYGMSRAWFQRQRWLNLPPNYYKVGSRCLYKAEELEQYFDMHTKSVNNNENKE